MADIKLEEKDKKNRKREGMKKCRRKERGKMIGNCENKEEIM